ncbi:hypothetical protein CUN85_05940 [Methanolobus halotolerans]|uniref:Uncharacterized protein n=1 Tax=Methanolobus halotolerans TaxID=2052935 RepID=A0A4E0PZI4_9EURY|nr:hypothetical protein CUN85_05940 [Methanolobus halotolerans]
MLAIRSTKTKKVLNNKQTGKYIIICIIKVFGIHLDQFPVNLIGLFNHTPDRKHHQECKGIRIRTRGKDIRISRAKPAGLCKG